MDYRKTLSALRGLLGPTGKDKIFEDLPRYFGSYEAAVFYGVLFHPPLREVEGIILHSLDFPELTETADTIETTREIIADWLRTTNGDVILTQIMMNHVHPWRWLGEEMPEIEPDEALIFPQMLAEAWESWLRFNYPGRSLVARVFGVEEALEQDYYGDIYVTFWEEPAPADAPAPSPGTEPVPAAPDSN